MLTPPERNRHTCVQELPLRPVRAKQITQLPFTGKARTLKELRLFHQKAKGSCDNAAAAKVRNTSAGRWQEDSSGYEVHSNAAIAQSRPAAISLQASWLSRLSCLPCCHPFECA